MINTKNDGVLGYGVRLVEVLETYSEERLKNVKDIYNLTDLQKQDGKNNFDNWVHEICECFRITLKLIDYEGYCTFSTIESDDTSTDSFGAPDEIMIKQNPKLYNFMKTHNMNAGIKGTELPFKKTNHTGRNELCPCGSGRKYKSCCLDKVEKIYIN